MIKAKLKSLVREQRGFTLIELLVAIAITASVTGAIATTLYQVIIGNAQGSNHITAVRQVQNAGYWITRDGQQAQVIIDGDDSATVGVTEFLVLSWVDWTAATSNRVAYTIIGNELHRSLSINGGAAVETTVARFINVNPADTNVTLNGNVITLTVTATVDGFPRIINETREYQIVPRPSL